GRLARAASPAARNESRHEVSVAAVTPSERDTVSRSSPRSRRSTASLLRCRDIRPPRPTPTAPEAVAVSVIVLHLFCGTKSASEVSHSTVERGTTGLAQALALCAARLCRGGVCRGAAGRSQPDWHRDRAQGRGPGRLRRTR